MECRVRVRPAAAPTPESGWPTATHPTGVGESSRRRCRFDQKSNQTASGWPALVDGIITYSDDGSPAFAFRALRGDSQRFHFCRALGEVLLSPDSNTLLTRTYSERQQRNRAFAAEFLAPASGLRDRISRTVVDADDIDGLAAEFGVSPHVIEHQIKNHRIARFSQALDSTG